MIISRNLASCEIAVAVLALALASAVAGCPNPQEEPAWQSPELPGGYLAGTLVTMAPSSATAIELPVQVWYPVTAAAGTAEATHVYDSYDITSGQAVSDGPAACAQSRPVVVFTHGNQALGCQFYTLTEYLARHGFVVAAPDHVFNTFVDNVEELRPAIHLRRPLDVADSFDELLRLAAPGQPLAGCIDPAAGYAVIGHSFGGWTTLATAGATLDMARMEARCVGDDDDGCRQVRAWRADHPGEDILDRSDPRVWAGVAFAPAFWEVFGDTGLAGVQVPMLVIGGDQDLTTPWEEDTLPVWDGLTVTPRYLVGLSGAGHYSFTDFCHLMALMYPGGCGEDTRPLDEVHATLRVLSLAFLQVTLGDQRAQPWFPPAPDAEGLSHFEAVP